MMKKILGVIVTVALLLACLPTGAAAATESSVDTITNAMKEFQTEITLKSDGVEEAFREAFEENPQLFYYFGGIDSPASSGKKRDITISYLYTDVPWDSIFVVNNDTDLYNAIGLALVDTLTEVHMVITDSTITTEDIVETIDQWKDDNYLVYMGFDEAYANVKSAEISAWTGCTLTLSYTEDPATVQEWRQATEDKVLELCQSLFALDMPDYQRELLIHDYIIEHCTYEETADDNAQYTAYGALVEGKAVCEGYAQAAQLLFSAAGLESYYVEGAGTSVDHAWNCVQIEDQYYWVDLTWDDPVPDVETGGTEILDHSYFNLTDSQLNEDHSWQYAKYPSCVSTLWGYDAVAEALKVPEGEAAPVYTEYSTKNVTTLAALRSDLIYDLGVDESKLTAADPESEETTDNAEVATDAAQDTAKTEKSGHPVLKALLVIVIILAVLVVAYLIYRRIMYLRMLARKRARQQARRNAARQGGGYGSAPRTSSTRSGSSRSSQARRKSTSSSSSNRRRRDNPFR
jgi:heme exporter protein D